MFNVTTPFLVSLANPYAKRIQTMINSLFQVTLRRSEKVSIHGT